MITLSKTLIVAGLTTVAATVLIGCEKADEVKSVQWYIEHRDQIMPTLERCKRLSADRDQDANCLNASRAMLAPAPRK